MAASHPLGRKLWFQVHKWIGIILAVLIIPISLTGSALVWHDALDRAINPARFAVSGAPGTLPPAAYAAAARAALPPGLRIASLNLPDAAGEPVIVAAAKPLAPGARPRPGPPARTNVYLDPADGRVLAVAESGSGPIRAMHMIHGSLMIPGVGRTIVGWIGVAMLVSSLSGLWLWWPTIGTWTRGLRWRRQPAFDGNLHHMIGFWICLPLAVLSLTGAWISFPAVFAALSGGAQQARGAGAGGGMDERMRRARAMPLETTRLAPDQALGAAARTARGTADVITWPTDQSPDWRIMFAGTRAEVTVNDATGAARAARGGGGGQTGIARTMRRIHDGTDMGLVWQTIIFLGGIAPAVLAVTGITMWLRTRRWRGNAARRPRARASVAA